MSVEPFFVVHDKPSILVVDDTPGNLAVMTALLKDEYRVKVAHSGERALRLVSSSACARPGPLAGFAASA